RVHILEKHLDRELDVLEKAKQAELDQQDKLHKDLVTRLHQAAIQPAPPRPVARSGISIRDVLAGEPDAITISDVDGLFALDDPDHEVPGTDREELAKRRAALQEGLTSLTKGLSASTVGSIDEIEAEHATRVKRLAKKRGVGDAPDTAAMP
ncbi:unnamed protein product, partial [Prorocentrum cordatum]